MPMGDRSNAVASVTGRVFREGWSRVRGSRQGLDGPRSRQMARAARGHRAAVFKPIRTGGCHTRAELVRQLEYLTTKSSHIVDSRAVLDGKQTLTGREIEAVADRFTRRWSNGFHPKLGQTTHMLMSFPIGTRGEDVRDIASEVCERYFASEDRHFDYLIAVHEDRAHPHAHIVLNRKSQKGEFFYLGRDHHFNYDDIRTAMVEAGERHGVRLEATRRIDRGATDYAPRAREVYAARDEGRVPEGRPRVGRDLKAAQAAVKQVAGEYRRMAKAEGPGKTREVLLEAGKLLGRGERVVPEGDVYTLGLRALDTALDRVRGAGSAEIATTFDDRHIGDFHANDEAIEDRCEVIQEELRSTGLGEAQLVLRASAIGARARSEIEREQHRWLDAHGTGAMMPGEACRWDANGHAVIVDPNRADSVEAMVARMRALRGMYPGRKGEAAIPDHLARGLGRTFAVVCDLRAAERAEAREAQHATEARAYLAQEAAVDRMQEVEALDARRAVRDAWKEGNATPYPAGHPEIARVVLHARSGKIESPFPDPARLDAFREEVADALGSEGLARLRGGDAGVFAPILTDRTDQLRAALHYVQNDEATGGRHGDAADRIAEELARREVDAIRLAHGTREGLTH